MALQLYSSKKLWPSVTVLFPNSDPLIFMSFFNVDATYNQKHEIFVFWGLIYFAQHGAVHVHILLFQYPFICKVLLGAFESVCYILLSEFSYDTGYILSKNSLLFQRPFYIHKVLEIE